MRFFKFNEVFMHGTFDYWQYIYNKFCPFYYFLFCFWRLHCVIFAFQWNMALWTFLSFKQIWIAFYWNTFYSILTFLSFYTIRHHFWFSFSLLLSLFLLICFFIVITIIIFSFWLFLNFIFLVLSFYFIFIYIEYF